MNPARALVLLVDDCVDTREMYAEFLSAAYDIVEASTGDEALRKARELSPAAIVMDLSLPDMGGEEAISNLRRSEHTDRIPVVVVSGYPEPRDGAFGWDAYLEKPCHPDALSACIGRVIARASA